MSVPRVISSDSHVVEPPNVWVERMDHSKFGDRIPHLVKGDPYDFWYADTKKTSPVGAITQAGLRFDRPQDIVQEGSFANVRPGGYIPTEHVKDLDLDGVYGSVVYPSTGLSLYEDLQDQELTQAIFAAYNDWLADFCKPYPERLKGSAMILIDDDVEQAVNELKRVSEIGLSSAMIPSYPRPDLTYDHPLYEPFWATAEEINITINLHVTTNRPTTIPMVKSGQTALTSSFVQHDHWVRMSLCHIIFSGVLERYPRIRLANVEHELGWLPFFMNRMDVAYSDRPQAMPYHFKNNALPSDFMRANVYHSFQEDDLGIQLRHLIGVGNLMWGSDYPHAESTFPKSREILERILEGVPPEEIAMIVGENAARVYGFY